MGKDGEAIEVPLIWGKVHIYYIHSGYCELILPAVHQSKVPITTSSHKVLIKEKTQNDALLICDILN